MKNREFTIYVVIGQNAPILQKLHDIVSSRSGENIKMGALLSYVYRHGQVTLLRQMKKDGIIAFKIMFDSGAYSTQTIGAEIRLSTYLYYLRCCHHNFDHVINLDDKFDDPDHNFAQHSVLEEGLGRKIVPVIHSKDFLDEVGAYYKKGHKFQMIGSKPKIKREQLDEIAVAFPDVNLHLLGTLENDLITAPNVVSVDSSEYAQAAKAGYVVYFDPHTATKHKLYFGGKDVELSEDVKKLDAFPHRSEFTEFLSRVLGLTPIELIGERSTENRWLVNLYYYWQLQNYINSLRK